MKKKIITAMILLSSLLFAEEITMDEAVNQALKNNKEVKQAGLNLENYNMQKDEALRSGIFSVNYNATYIKYDKDTAGIPSENSVSHGVSLTQPVFVGGKVLAGIKTAGIYAKSGEYTLENIKKNVRLDIMSQYLNILMFEKNREVLKSSLNELNENYKRLEESYKLKMVTKTELLELKYSIINLESSIIEVENAIEIYKLKLKNDIGFDKNSELELVDFENPEIDLESIDLDKDLETAATENLNLQLAKISYKLKKESEVITRADLLPEVYFSFSYGANAQENVGDAMDPDNMNWLATLSFNMNIWDWGNNYSRYKRDKNDTKSAELAKDKAVEDINLNIRSRYLELLRLDKLQMAKEEALKSAKENYELEKERYAADLISTTDYIAAQNRVMSSETELINTRLNYYLAYEMYKNEIEGEGN